MTTSPNGVPAPGLVGVLETDPTGHRLHYVRHLLTAGGAQTGVLITTREVLESPEFTAHLRPAGITRVVLTDTGSRSAVLDAALRWAADASARLIVVPDGDKYVVPLLRRRLGRRRAGPDVRLLIMRTATLGGPEGRSTAMVLKPVLVQALRLVPGVSALFLTDALGVVGRRRGYPGLPPVRDPVPPPGSDALARPDWVPSRAAGTVVGLFGVISTRKNLPVLVRAVDSLPAAVLVVAGRLEPEARRFVETDPSALRLRAEGRLTLVDRLVDHDEFTAGLASVDVVAVLHDNDSPSGILGEACARGTPVVVPRGGWLQRVVETSGIGAAVPLTTDGVAAGITRIAECRDDLAAAARAWSANIGTNDFSRRLLAP
jgi:glycosyltransferase involved in cell wall biosynthesis